MRQVLDEIEQKKNEKRIFSKISLTISVIIIVLLSKLNSYLKITTEVIYNVEHPTNELIYAILIFLIFGVISSVISFSKREPSTWFKWIGGILNFLFFLLIAGSIIFAQLI